MVKIVKADFEGQVMQFNEDGWFNATLAASKYGKDPYEWLRLESTTQYLAALKSKYGEIPYFRTKRGKNGGTWLHPKLAVLFARWLSVDFAIWCDEQIDGIIHGTPEQTDWKRVRHEAAATYKVMSSMLDMKRQLEGKETKPYHYANEAKLVNWALTGEYKPLDREQLTHDQLDLLAKLESLNTLLIGQDIERDLRKVALIEATRKHLGLDSIEQLGK